MSTSTEPLGSRNTCDTPSLIFLLHIKEVIQMRLEEFRKKYFKEVNDMEKERKEEFGIKRKNK